MNKILIVLIGVLAVAVTVTGTLLARVDHNQRPASNPSSTSAPVWQQDQRDHMAVLLQCKMALEQDALDVTQKALAGEEDAGANAKPPAECIGQGISKAEFVQLVDEVTSQYGN